MAGKSEAALATLEAAVKARPGDARPSSRGPGQTGPGARAAGPERLSTRQPDGVRRPRPAAGAAQAHLYRGVWLFRRGLYDQAENEFSSALNDNLEPP